MVLCQDQCTQWTLWRNKGFTYYCFCHFSLLQNTTIASMSAYTCCEAHSFPTSIALASSDGQWWLVISPEDWFVPRGIHHASWHSSTAMACGICKEKVHKWLLPPDAFLGLLLFGGSTMVIKQLCFLEWHHPRAHKFLTLFSISLSSNCVIILNICVDSFSWKKLIDLLKWYVFANKQCHCSHWSAPVSFDAECLLQWIQLWYNGEQCICLQSWWNCCIVLWIMQEFGLPVYWLPIFATLH